MRGFPAFICVTLLVVASVARSADAGFLEVNRIFARQCVMCHQPYDAKGELTLHPSAAWQNVVEVGSGQVDMFLVTPGDLEQSYLYRKLTNTHLEVGGTGDQMPFDAQLSAEELETIRMWIEQGAKNQQ